MGPPGRDGENGKLYFELASFNYLHIKNKKKCFGPKYFFIFYLNIKESTVNLVEMVVQVFLAPMVQLVNRVHKVEFACCNVLCRSRVVTASKMFEK